MQYPRRGDPPTPTPSSDLEKRIEEAGDQPLGEMLEAERTGWHELLTLIESLTLEQDLEPDSFLEGWSVKDLLAHIACWFAEAGMVLEQIRGGTFHGRDLDVERMNAACVEANRDQPMQIVRAEAHAARSRMLGELDSLHELTPDAEAWIRKAGPEHYAEHLPHLRDWVQELRVTQSSSEAPKAIDLTTVPSLFAVEWQLPLLHD